VHSDDHETVPESPLEVTQFLDDAQAVDAAEGPEIEHHYASAQVAQGQGDVRVDPSAGATELWRAPAPVAVVMA
jgi:hypothetical protein